MQKVKISQKTGHIFALFPMRGYGLTQTEGLEMEVCVK